MKLTTSGFSEAISKIGKIREQLKPIPDSPIFQFMENLSRELTTALIESLNKTTESGNLSASIVPEVTLNGDTVELTIKANDYWDFVNSGVNGLQKGVGSEFSFRTPYANKKMAESLQEGMRAKGIPLPSGFKDYESYSYAAAVKLKRDGIEPNHFVDNVLSDSFIDKLSLTLADELGKKIIINIG